MTPLQRYARTVAVVTHLLIGFSLCAGTGTEVDGPASLIRIDSQTAIFDAKFQDLEGRLTKEGLWIRSTEFVNGQFGEQFRVVADSLGRTQGQKVSLAMHGADVGRKASA